MFAFHHIYQYFLIYYGQNVAAKNNFVRNTNSWDIGQFWRITWNDVQQNWNPTSIILQRISRVALRGVFRFGKSFTGIFIINKREYFRLDFFMRINDFLGSLISVLIFVPQMDIWGRKPVAVNSLFTAIKINFCLGLFQECHLFVGIVVLHRREVFHVDRTICVGAVY